VKQLVILSGKGGTGKTTVAAALAHLASRSQPIILADADVDAANLELVLAPRRLERHEFVSGEVAVIDGDSCTGCGACASACRFEAIVLDSGPGALYTYRVVAQDCEGCAACYYACQSSAITMRDRHAGEWYASETRYGLLLHAHLYAGQENSGKLVTLLRQEAVARGTDSGARLAIVDGPPGIGCPVIASVSGVDEALIVTEPSVSGIHDLARALQTTSHFGARSAVVVNKADLNPERTQEIARFCAGEGVPVLGEIPYDLAAVHAMVNGRPVVDGADGPLPRALHNLWNRLAAALDLRG